MPTLTSKLNLRSDEFKAASMLMRQLVADLGHKLEQIAEGGGAAAQFFGSRFFRFAHGVDRQGWEK